jgi:hypothetical protein
MKLDLRAKSSMGVFLLCDPAAVTVPADPPVVDVESEVRRGNLIAYHGGDAERFVVLIDEPAARAADDREPLRGLLRVPSGRLVAAGWEDLAEATAHSIPAGNYDVAAFERDDDEEREVAIEREVRAAHPRGVAVESVLGPITGMLIAGTLLCGIGGAAIVLAGDLSLGSLARFGAVLAGVWALVIGLWKISGASAASRARETARAAKRASFPTAIIHLQRLPEGADVADRSGLEFGPGFDADVPHARALPPR